MQDPNQEDQLTKNGAESQEKIDIFISSLRGEMIRNGTETLYASLVVSENEKKFYVGKKLGGARDNLGKSFFEKWVPRLRTFVLGMVILFCLLLIFGLIDIGKLKKIACRITGSDQINLGILSYNCRK